MQQSLRSFYQLCTANNVGTDPDPVLYLRKGNPYLQGINIYYWKDLLEYFNISSEEIIQRAEKEPLYDVCKSLTWTKIKHGNTYYHGIDDICAQLNATKEEYTELIARGFSVREAIVELKDRRVQPDQFFKTSPENFCDLPVTVIADHEDGDKKIFDYVLVEIKLYGVRSLPRDKRIAAIKANQDILQPMVHKALSRSKILKRYGITPESLKCDRTRLRYTDIMELTFTLKDGESMRYVQNGS